MAGLTTIWKTLRQLELTLKKSLVAAEQTRADVAEARRLWQELQPRLDRSKLIFLDETWTKVARLYGRSGVPTRSS